MDAVLYDVCPCVRMRGMCIESTTHPLCKTSPPALATPISNQPMPTTTPPHTPVDEDGLGDQRRPVQRLLRRRPRPPPARSLPPFRQRRRRRHRRRRPGPLLLLLLCRLLRRRGGRLAGAATASHPACGGGGSGGRPAGGAVMHGLVGAADAARLHNLVAAAPTAVHLLASAWLLCLCVGVLVGPSSSLRRLAQQVAVDVASEQRRYAVAAKPLLCVLGVTVGKRGALTDDRCINRSLILRPNHINSSQSKGSKQAKIETSQ